MKILQITPLFYPHDGGIERHVGMLSHELINRGHDVTVYTTNIPLSKKYEVIDGLLIYRFNSLFSLMNNQFAPNLFLKMLEKEEFDVVHIHSHLHMSSNFAAFSKLFRNRPFVLTSHGVLNYGGSESWKNIIQYIYNNTACRWTLNSADKIIALSNSQADILKRLGASQEKIAIVPNWINLKRINCQLDTSNFRKKHKLSSKVIVLFVGSFLKRKGLKYLIDAMSQVDSDVELLVIGREHEGHFGVKNEIENQSRKLGIHNINFLGEVSDEELSLAYLTADIVVIPSLAEGLPFVLLEAMAHKKCVLATKIPGISDVIKDNKNGLLCEPANELDLAKKLNYAIRNPQEREKIGENARRDIEENYDFNNVIKSIEDVYLSVSSR